MREIRPLVRLSLYSVSKVVCQVHSMLQQWQLHETQAAVIDVYMVLDHDTSTPSTLCTAHLTAESSPSMKVKLDESKSYMNHDYTLL